MTGDYITITVVGGITNELFRGTDSKDGVVKEGNVLKVDSFLNHQMDIELLKNG